MLVIEDNRDSPDGAVDAVRKLAFQENVVAIVGPRLSRNAIPAANVAEQARVPLISPTSTNPQTTEDKTYIFRASFIDTFQGRVMAQFAAEDLGVQRAAVLYDVASEYNRGLAETFKQAFEAFLDDPDNYYFVTDSLAATRSVSNASFPGWPSFLDNMLISHSLFDEYVN